MSDKQPARTGVRERWKARKAANGDSPERRSENRGPKPDGIDRFLKAGGVERPSRFKKD
jgi:hypothetical protein